MQEKAAFLILFLIIPLSIYSQEHPNIKFNNGFSIIPYVSYVSSATIQLYPYSNNLAEKSQIDELTGGYGYGFTVRKKLFREDLTFGISVEYTNIKDESLVQTFMNDSLTVRARVTEELTVIPVEFTGYFNLPDFSEDLRIFLGGGLGVYFGDRKRTVLNIESKTVSKKTGFSIVVLSGMEYKFSKQFSGVFEVKFREAEYKVKSEYPVSEIKINGVIYDLDRDLNSKIFVDGLKLSLGISYNF